MSSSGYPGDEFSPGSMEETLDSFEIPSLEPAGQAPQRPRARTGPFLFGMILIGVGGAAAIAAQTALTLGQSGSILLLTCAVLALGFLVFRSSRAATDS